MPDIVPIREEMQERSWGELRAEFRANAHVALRERLVSSIVRIADPFTGKTRQFKFDLLPEGALAEFALVDNGEVVFTGDLHFGLAQVPDETMKLLLEQMRRAHIDTLAAMPDDVGFDHDGPPLPDNATDDELLAYTESLIQKESKS